jgi:hypothetical protein
LICLTRALPVLGIVRVGTYNVIRCVSKSRDFLQVKIGSRLGGAEKGAVQLSTWRKHKTFADQQAESQF